MRITEFPIQEVIRSREGGNSRGEVLHCQMPYCHREVFEIYLRCRRCGCICIRCSKRACLNAHPSPTGAIKPLLTPEPVLTSLNPTSTMSDQIEPLMPTKRIKQFNTNFKNVVDSRSNQVNKINTGSNNGHHIESVFICKSSPEVSTSSAHVIDVHLFAYLRRPSWPKYLYSLICASLSVWTLQVPLLLQESQNNRKMKVSEGPELILIAINGWKQVFGWDRIYC